MTTYLTIITTALVLTQVIRVTQNHIHARKQDILFKKQIGELADLEIRKADFEYQRKAYRLIVKKLESEEENSLEDIAGCVGCGWESTENCKACKRERD